MYSGPWDWEIVETPAATDEVRGQQSADLQAVSSNLDALSAAHTGAPACADGIVTSHWRSKSSRERCAGCDRTLGAVMRRLSARRCRRCGDVFCRPCTDYVRRLSYLARPDPGGLPHRVCRSCYDEPEPQPEGATRRWMLTFTHLRREARGGASARRLVVDFDGEVERLRDGFRRSLKMAPVSARWFGAAAAPPYWQRPRDRIPPPDASATCEVCGAAFGLVLRRRRDCSVCGRGACARCSTQDGVLVYVPAEQSPHDDPTFDVLLAVVGVAGCPEVAPPCRTYLPACDACRKALGDGQARDHSGTWEGGVPDVSTETRRIYARATEIREKIDRQLPTFCELADALDVSPPAGSDVRQLAKAQLDVAPPAGGDVRRLAKVQIDVAPPAGGDVRRLAKVQIDVAELFASFVGVVSGARALLVAATPAQTSVLRNLSRGQLEEYRARVAAFRRARRHLEERAPAGALRAVQGAVEREAIGAAHVSVKQLAYEALLLADRHALAASLAGALVRAEAAIADDLRACVAAEADAHMADAERLLREQLREHRLVRLPRGAGRDVAAATVLARCAVLTAQVETQLEAKCVETRFPGSREALKKCHEAIRRIAPEDLLKGPSS